MRITFLRIYKEARNPSMKLYADRLKKALEALDGALEINDFSPYGVFLPLAGRFWITTKIQDYLTRFWYYRQRVKKIKSDIFHIVDHANAYLMGNLDRRRVVITCHDLITLKFLKEEIPLGYEKQMRNWFAIKAFLWSAKYIPNAARLIANSEETKQEMVRLLGCQPDKIQVIYYGIDPVFKKIEEQEKLMHLRHDLAGNARHILLHVASKSNYKNFAGIIQAMRILIQRYGDDLLLIRVGEITKIHHSLIRKFHLERYIKIIPEKSPAELNLFYNFSDVFVFPSLYEGFGWPAVEAMACGLPVVSSDKGGLKEAVGDASYIVEPYDAKNMADGIIRVIENKEVRESLLQKGLARIKKFSWEEAARKTRDIYRGL